MHGKDNLTLSSVPPTKTSLAYLETKSNTLFVLAYDEPSVDNDQRWAHNDEEQARGGRERVHMDKKTK